MPDVRPTLPLSERRLRRIYQHLAPSAHPAGLPRDIARSLEMARAAVCHAQGLLRRHLHGGPR